MRTSKDAATPDICYVIMQKDFHILFTFLCVSTFEKVVREGKNMAFSLCLADEERLAETVKAFPCLHDKTKKGYKEKDVVTNAWNSVANTSHDKEQRKHIHHFFIAVFTRIHLLHLTACVALL